MAKLSGDDAAGLTFMIQRTLPYAASTTWKRWAKGWITRGDRSKQACLNATAAASAHAARVGGQKRLRAIACARASSACSHSLMDPLAARTWIKSAQQEIDALIGAAKVK